MKIKNTYLKISSYIIIGTCFNCKYFCRKITPDEKVSKKGTYNPVPKIMHHIQNSHEWHLFDYKDNEGKLHPVSIPLPVILYTEWKSRFFYVK